MGQRIHSTKFGNFKHSGLPSIKGCGDSARGVVADQLDEPWVRYDFWQGREAPNDM